MSKYFAHFRTIRPILVVGAALIYCIFLWCILRTGDFPGLEGKIDLQQRYRLKVIWAALYFALTCSLAWHIINSLETCWIFCKCFSKQWMLRLLSLFLLVNFIGYGCIIWHYISFGGKASDEVVSKITSMDAVPVDKLTAASNCLALTAILLTIAVACFLSRQLTFLTIRSVKQNIDRFMSSLYSAAILLAIGLSEISALYRWGFHFAIVEDAGKSSVADGFSFSAGLLFSLLLVLIYVPVSLTHHAQLEAVLRRKAHRDLTFDTGKWLQRNGLKSPPLPMVGVLLVPLVTGVLNSVLKIAA